MVLRLVNSEWMTTASESILSLPYVVSRCNFVRGVVIVFTLVLLRPNTALNELFRSAGCEMDSSWVVVPGQSCGYQSLLR